MLPVAIVLPVSHLFSIGVGGTKVSVDVGSIDAADGVPLTIHDVQMSMKQSLVKKASTRSATALKTWGQAQNLHTTTELRMFRYVPCSKC